MADEQTIAAERGRQYAWLEHDLHFGYIKGEQFVQLAVAIGIDPDLASEDLQEWQRKAEHGPSE